MKYSILFFLVVLTSANAQKKYQSLLWEISGNGAQKNSYLYGSMHVSEKVSYHLSDAFFKHLLAADFVANESEPSTWLELYDVLKPGDYYEESKFYSNFYQYPAKRNQLEQLFVTNNSQLNNILFRTNDSQKDYQEDTYLDMFIHQAGKKYNKQTVGLEDAKTSMISIMNNSEEMRPKEENIPAIMKLLKEKSFDQALIDYYRDKNLDMIDSIYSLIAPESFLKILLYDRNEIMSHNIDSLAQKGSLFAAIGAAHLPGTKGVIESLRKKGYTVTPISDAYTQKGKSTKKEIDNFYIKPAFETKTTSDQMISVPMFTKAIYNGENISTPDLANGGSIELQRIPLRYYLRKDGKSFDPKSLDSLFYERIPGDIIAKNFTKQEDYSYYDITSATTTGNAQHYRFYITPLEIIGITMSGNGDYVRKYESNVFSKIALQKITTDWQTIYPNKGGFSIEAPRYFTLYGDRVSGNSENLELSAFDQTDNSYYFLTERTSTDFTALENTQFELERIQREFSAQIDSKFILGKLTPAGYESIGTIGDKTLALKTVIIGAKYYLLGTVGATSSSTMRFFNSFKQMPFAYSENLRKLTNPDESFEIIIPQKQNEKLFWKAANVQKPWNPNSKTNAFIGNTNLYNINSVSGKQVILKTLHYHRYATEKNIDSVFAYFRRTTKAEFFENLGLGDNDYNSNQYKFSRSTWNAKLKKGLEATYNVIFEKEKITHDKQTDTYKLETLLTTESSSQAIKHEVYFNNGSLYSLSALVDKKQNIVDPFIKKTFESFKIIESKKLRSVFESKVDLFIADAKSELDSLRYSALASVYMVDLTDDDALKITQFVNSFDFKNDELQAKSDLIEKIGFLKSEKVIPFLEQHYKATDVSTNTQFAVIRALTNQKSKSAYKKILQLLEYDLPLSDNEYEISGIFDKFADNLSDSKIIFPDIFQFFSVSEYQDPILNFTTKLFESKLVNSKQLGNYRKLLLTDAKLELKRLSSWKSQNLTSSSRQAPAERTKTYVTLLERFKKDRATNDYLRNVEKVNIAQLNLELAIQKIDNNEIVDADLQQKLLADSETAFIAFLLFNSQVKDSNVVWTDEQIANASMSYFLGDPTKISLNLIEKRDVAIDEKQVAFYIYRVKTVASEENYSNGFDEIAAVAFVKNHDKIDPQAYKYVDSYTIINESDLQPIVEQIIDEALNDTKSRASFGKINRNATQNYDD